jgi:hypothetical protein
MRFYREQLRTLMNSKPLSATTNFAIFQLASMSRQVVFS